MGRYSNIKVIANPQSGKSDSKDFEELIKEQLSKYYKTVDFEYTKEVGDATIIAAKACEDNYHSICSVGGDGTLSEVIEGMVKYEKSPKLVIFPAGTGNIMSKSLKIGQNKKTVINSIDFTKTKKIDIGKAGEKVFSFALSIGQIPEAINEVTNEEKEKNGFFAYFSNLIKRLIRKRKTHYLRVIVDGKEYEGKVDHLLILVSDKFGNLNVPNEESSIDDGYLNLYILKKGAIFEKLRVGIEVIIGNLLDNENVEYMKGKNIRIESLNSEKINVDLDGDRGPRLPLDVSILNKSIEVFTGKKYIK